MRSKARLVINTWRIMGKVIHKDKFESKVSHKNMEDHWKFAINPKKSEARLAIQVR